MLVVSVREFRLFELMVQEKLRDEVKSLLVTTQKRQLRLECCLAASRKNVIHPKRSALQKIGSTCGVAATWECVGSGVGCFCD